jgi:hypothetical protein
MDTTLRWIIGALVILNLIGMTIAAFIIMRKK